VCDRFYDVPAFFGPDASRFKNFVNLWYGGSNKLDKPPVPSTVCISCGIKRRGEAKYTFLLTLPHSVGLDKDSVPDGLFSYYK
jgi:hypothetical protein